MSDTVVYFPQATTAVYFTENPTVVYFPACPPSGGSINLGQLTALLNQYPDYPNDTEARADGLTTGDLYWFSEDTDAGTYDTLKRVSPL